MSELADSKSLITFYDKASVFSSSLAFRCNTYMKRIKQRKAGNEREVVK